MDEATSNIDQKTDQQIQDMLRSEFRETTILTIAHRLETIMDYDKIVVMDKGQLAEMGTVEQLMEIEDGIFKSMVEEDKK